MTALESVAAPDPNFHIYLLFGQSNMEGWGAIEAQDRTVNNRVKVMADMDCSDLGRTYGNWYVASPPLNRCWAGIGPGDYFGKSMADAMPANITIGLVPAALSGVAIEFYQKSEPIGKGDAIIPPGFNGGYSWLLALAKKAQEQGVIKGIIFHQGESNNGNAQWKYKVQEIVSDLRKDLGIGEVPFLAGELLYSEYGSCCGVHNLEVNKLPDVIPNTFVISAAGLPGADTAHFTTASYRELGMRYARVMASKVSPYSDNNGTSSSNMSSSSLFSSSASSTSSVFSSAANSSAASSAIRVDFSENDAVKSSSSSGGSLGLLDLWLIALVVMIFCRLGGASKR